MQPIIDRRGFMTIGAGALVAGAYAARGPAAYANIPAARQGGAPRKMKKAVGIGMVGDGATLADKFKLLKDLGFDGVELNRPGEPAIDEVIKARDAAQITIANIVDSVHWGQTLSDPDAAVRKKGREGLEAALRDAKALGCKTVLLVPAVVNEKVSYADAYVRSQTEIKNVLPLAKDLGVYICIENVWNQFLLSPLEAARYIDELESPYAGFHFDVGNIINYGWPEQWIRTLGSRIHNVHIKEYSRKKRDAEGLWKGFDVDLLDGDNRWPEVMKAFHEIGYEGFGVAEINGGDRARLKVVAEKMDKIFSM
ncbi:MAG: sugar phosphate isomerase/epimerase [Planctomycetes bacterium]|nr:sugar phosphate isomerase/epimerase [Planctomycetota bacterium]